MINTQMNIINDNIINIHPSTLRNHTLPVTQSNTIPNVSQNKPTSKTTTAKKIHHNTQETINSITANGDDDILWEDDYKREDDLSDI